ncbi:MAG: peptide-methionine (S)-S-oxide reductase MsrA [Acidimicrobiia bacterium]
MFKRSMGTVLSAETALPGRPVAPEISGTHFVSGRTVVPPFPAGIEVVYLGMGCFWGAERVFWSLPGVYTTAVGYAGGFTKNASYEDVCSGRTGHTEIVLVAYDPTEIPLGRILKSFWEEHDPTQGDRQGNDRGTQYRSAIYWTTPDQQLIVTSSRDADGSSLGDAGLGGITTELAEAGPFYYAEEYHQQYLAKNPDGYCGLAGTGISCSL